MAYVTITISKNGDVKISVDTDPEKLDIPYNPGADKNPVVEKEVDTAIMYEIFSNRTANCLRSAGIKSIEQFTNCCENELLNIQNMGKRSLVEIKEFLAKHNMSLKF